MTQLSNQVSRLKEKAQDGITDTYTQYFLWIFFNAFALMDENDSTIGMGLNKTNEMKKSCTPCHVDENV